MKMIKSLSVVVLLAASCFADNKNSGFAFEPLPYAYNALEPHIDAQTMEIHYDRHHRGYFNNLLKAVEGTAFADMPLESILAQAGALPDALRNNAGGHYNHALFWKLLSPNGGGLPKGKLLKKINDSFGSFEKFRDEFKKSALGRFGSGWAWLCVAQDGSLFITSTPNQDNPLMDTAQKRGKPILGVDVWEHAYYLKYQNKRADYLDSIWNVINWAEVSARYEKTLKKN